MQAVLAQLDHVVNCMLKSCYIPRRVAGTSDLGSNRGLKYRTMGTTVLSLKTRSKVKLSVNNTEQEQYTLESIAHVIVVNILVSCFVTRILNVCSTGQENMNTIRIPHWIYHIHDFGMPGSSRLLSEVWASRAI